MKALSIIAAVLFALLMLPFAFVGGLIGLRGRKCSPEELASELNALAAGEMRGWDDLECGGHFKDPRLEAIRQEAMTVDLPFRDEDRVLLARLAAKAAALPPQS